MRISAENVLRGTITEITEGAADGLITLDVSGEMIRALISSHAIHELGLKVGMNAAAIIKASDVMLALKQRYAISARNQLSGTVVSIEKGSVNAFVTVETDDGLTIVASTSWQSIQELDIKAGTHVTAVIKAASVMLAVEA